METNFTCQNGCKVRIEGKSKIVFLEMKDITHITCDGYLSKVFLLNSETISIAKILKKFEEELTPFGFARVNRSTLVNLRHIREYKSGSKRTLELVNEIRICVSRRKAYIFRLVY